MEIKIPTINKELLISAIKDVLEDLDDFSLEVHLGFLDESSGTLLLRYEENVRHSIIKIDNLLKMLRAIKSA